MVAPANGSSFYIILDTSASMKEHDKYFNAFRETKHKKMMKSVEDFMSGHAWAKNDDISIIAFHTKAKVIIQN